MGRKDCAKCRETKNTDTDFYRAGKYYTSYCKVCHNKGRMKYYEPRAYKRACSWTRMSQDCRETIALLLKHKSPTELASDLGLSYYVVLRWSKLAGKDIDANQVVPQEAKQALNE
jgi:hypothetical protein